MFETHTLAAPQIHAHGLAYRKKQRNHHANVAVHQARPSAPSPSPLNRKAYICDRGM